MRAIGNFLWFVFGGFLMGLGWWFAGLISALMPRAATRHRYAGRAAPKSEALGIAIIRMTELVKSEGVAYGLQSKR